LDGKIRVFDLDNQSSMIFYHHIEEMCGVSYRLHKEFTGHYTDANGVTSEGKKGQAHTARLCATKAW